MEAVENMFEDLGIDWLYPLSVSLGHIAVVFIVCHILRLVNRKLLPKSVRPYVSEVICMYHLTACVFENGMVVAPRYGVSAFATLLFCCAIGFGLTFDGHGNPCSILNDFLQKRTSLLTTVCKTAFNVLGGFIALLHLKSIWSIGILEHHMEIIETQATQQCPSAMQTTMALGMMAEFSATMVIRFQAGFEFGGKNFAGIVFAILVVSFTLAGAQYTGMFLNPALATAFTFNCADHPVYEHLLVYWVAPYLATILVFFIVKYMKKTPKRRRGGGKSKQNGVPKQKVQKNGIVKEEGKSEGKGKKKARKRY
ncbi:aquaporin-11-like [Saccoglossus kowalevskii]|uniref:Aquaporin-12A-like n=1 Tax=Saccoglossus kowalevskii TaxID=10224 RepID=A0ABM0H155_SACKO|nr:PREDICTED: aquaporin-12A-like [Saccoglossus kowalevskii]